MCNRDMHAGFNKYQIINSEGVLKFRYPWIDLYYVQTTALYLDS